MIKIYCLIDPRNNKPFYVGATKCRLYNRLSNHINECKTLLPEYWSSKHRLINEIKESGNRPVIHLIYECPKYATDHYERFFFNMLKGQGFDLLQNPTFSYAIKHQEGKLINGWHKLKINKKHSLGLIVKKN